MFFKRVESQPASIANHYILHVPLVFLGMYTNLGLHIVVPTRSFLLGFQNSLSGNNIGATTDQMYRAAVTQLVTILTHTDGQPTSTSFPLSPTEVDQPVRSIAEYMLAREKMRWKNEYEYVTGLAFSLSSCSSALLSSGRRGFPAPSTGR